MSSPARRNESEKAHIIILAIALVAVLIGMSFLSPHFLSVRNLLNASRFMAEIGLLSLGMAVVVISGGIDLSVGSVMALCAVAMGLLVSAGMPVLPAAALVLLLGVAAGALNGVVVTRLGLPAIIATLATLAVYRGIALGISGGEAFPVGEDFAWLGQGMVMGVPVQLVVLVAAAIAVGVVLRHTIFGRTIYSVGANEIAARFSGLKVQRAKLSAYALSGLFAAAAALIFVSRVSSAKANAGTGYELDAITIVVLAGIPITGGRGSIVAVMLALVTIGLVRNGMTLAFIQTDIQAVLIGALLILAVIMNRLLELLPATSKLPDAVQTASASTAPGGEASAHGSAMPAGSGRSPTQ
ncbi:MAG: ABC transporter permease [Rhizobiaceae bacterium]|nr:ABC transporter permease [Rhizobiaceae bacterium]